MATDATKVRASVTGAIFRGATTLTAPADATPFAAPAAGFVDLGFLSEDGVEMELPEAGDSEPLRAWQNGIKVREFRTPSEDNPTWAFTMLETSIATIETYFGVTVTSAANHGSFEFTNSARPYQSYILDAIDGTELLRDYIPRGIVTSVGAVTHANAQARAYEVTVEGELDATKGYHFKRWETALKTVA